MTVAEIGQRMGAAEAREWQALWILDSAPPEEMPAARPPAAATGFRVDSGPVGPDTDLAAPAASRPPGRTAPGPG